MPSVDPVHSSECIVGSLLQMRVEVIFSRCCEMRASADGGKSLLECALDEKRRMQMKMRKIDWMESDTASGLL